MKELWIGQVEVLTGPDSSGGDTRAFTNVVTWADNSSTYADRVTKVFAGYDWTVLGIENARPIPPGVEFDEDIADAIDRAASNSDACIFSTFHYYPSPLS